MAAKKSNILYIRNAYVADPAKGGVQITDEPIWSENTGRDVNSGQMIGDIVGWKKTVQITWPPLDFASVQEILNAINVRGKTPFFTLKYPDTSATSLTEITVYTGAPQRTIESINAAYRRQMGFSVTFIER